MVHETTGWQCGLAPSISLIPRTQLSNSVTMEASGPQHRKLSNEVGKINSRPGDGFREAGRESGAKDFPSAGVPAARKASGSKKGTFGGPGTSSQNTSTPLQYGRIQFVSVSPETPPIQFGSVGLDDVSAAIDGLVDSPKLSRVSTASNSCSSQSQHLNTEPGNSLAETPPGRALPVAHNHEQLETGDNGKDCLLSSTLPVSLSLVVGGDSGFESAVTGSNVSQKSSPGAWGLQGKVGPAEVVHGPPLSIDNEGEYPSLSASSTAKSGAKCKRRQDNPTTKGSTGPGEPRKISSGPQGRKEHAELEVAADFDEARTRNVKRAQSKGWQGGQRNSAMDRDSAIESLGRTMTRILRHQASEMRLNIGSDGYVDVEDLLRLKVRTASNRLLSSHTVDDVLEAVKKDAKKRFGILNLQGRVLVRANQGHTMKSVESNHLLKPILSRDEVPVCVHGTYRKFMPLILKEGLKRMTRNHVHFATGNFGEGHVISGMRSTSEVLIYLNVEKALADGMNLFISENGVILTEGFDGVIPPKYFAEVLVLPRRKPLTPPSMEP